MAINYFISIQNQNRKNNIGDFSFTGTTTSFSQFLGYNLLNNACKRKDDREKMKFVKEVKASNVLQIIRIGMLRNVLKL